MNIKNDNSNQKRQGAAWADQKDELLRKIHRRTLPDWHRFWPQSKKRKQVRVGEDLLLSEFFFLDFQIAITDLLKKLIRWCSDTKTPLPGGLYQILKGLSLNNIVQKNGRRNNINPTEWIQNKTTKSKTCRDTVWGSKTALIATFVSITAQILFFIE